ncbi:MAG: hypothetical protein F6J98_27965 [Moorea sp. SIO4G2]|uniref:hypothetical protein n=1 Tax=unclassified Moorena TaxID=2683338 RepID=UPI0013F9B348|nr:MULTISPECIES: hypothetical protein [unclassified Moorena]NEO14255.1 hypothetical protein [Moorena sp. SIO3E8]NEO64045.1 hypothetical protein [Moorena sp. SIO4G2]NEQ00202.1 hypothetical protein [Moorena sp. SIO3F7]
MKKRTLLKLHRTLAPILFLPLLLTTITGIVYRIGNTWFGMPRKYAQIMMAIHEGRFLGKELVPIYVLWNGLGMIGLLATGIVLSGVFRNQRTQASNSHRGVINDGNQ